MKKWVVVVTLLIAVQSWGAPRFADQLDSSRDLVKHRAVVPNPAQPQGEVQVIERGELLVIQTLLASPVLKRVASAIVDREKKRWLPGSEGYAGSMRYQEALHEAVGQAWQAFRSRSDQQEKRQFMAIEFIVGPRHNLVALSLPVLEGLPGNLHLVEKKVLMVWQAPRDYVAMNSRVIVADSFGLTENEAYALLSAMRVHE